MTEANPKNHVWERVSLRSDSPVFVSTPNRRVPTPQEGFSAVRNPEDGSIVVVNREGVSALSPDQMCILGHLSAEELAPLIGGAIRKNR